MDPIYDFDTDIDWVLDRCEKRVSTYPPALRHSGLAYLAKHRFLKGKERRRGIFFSLPFWLNDHFELDRDTCRRVALGSTYALLHFLVQDEVMDTGPDEYKAHLLPLGNLFLLDLIAQYRSLLGTNSGFWSLFENYVAQWAESMTWERELHWGQVQDFSDEDLILLGRKAAPLKIPCAAMCLLGNHTSALELLSRMVEYDQLVFQLIDDMQDWQDDLIRGNYTYFLTKVMIERNLHDPAQLSSTEVGKAIFVGKVPEAIFELAKEHLRRALESVSGLHVPYLKAHIALQSDYCDRLLEEMNAERERVLRAKITLFLG